MESKNEIKIGLGTVISIIVILALIAVIFFIIYNNNIKINDLERTMSKQKADYEQILEEQKNNAKKDSEENEIEETNSKENNETKNNTKFVAPSIHTGIAKNVEEDARYELIMANESYFWAEIEDGKVYIGTGMGMNDEALYRWVETDQVKIKNQQSQEIAGFNKKVVDVHFANLSQNDIATHVLFLMEDGTVEYSSINNIIINATSQGKLEGLENIIKVQDVEVYYDDGGHCSTILIDKDNNYYDIAKYIK